MPLGYLVTNVAACLIIALMGTIGTFAHKWPKPLRTATDLAGTLIAAAILTALVVAPFKLAGIWLPKESVTVTGQPSAIGYVLSSDEAWTKYMDEGKQIHIATTDSVARRDVVNKTPAWYHQTLNELRPKVFS